jgi:hypothetical protein
VLLCVCLSLSCVATRDDCTPPRGSIYLGDAARETREAPQAEGSS